MGDYRTGLSWNQAAMITENYKRFSIERLLHCITLLNRDVEIFIRPRINSNSNSSGVGVVKVWAAA
jgi:hypothetical protein